ARRPGRRPGRRGSRPGRCTRTPTPPPPWAGVRGGRCRGAGRRGRRPARGRTVSGSAIDLSAKGPSFLCEQRRHATASRNGYRNRLCLLLLFPLCFPYFLRRTVQELGHFREKGTVA